LNKFGFLLEGNYVENSEIFKSVLARIFYVKNVLFFISNVLTTPNSYFVEFFSIISAFIENLDTFSRLFK
jgi:hypothetical protein